MSEIVDVDSFMKVFHRCSCFMTLIHKLLFDFFQALNCNGRDEICNSELNACQCAQGYVYSENQMCVDVDECTASQTDLNPLTGRNNAPNTGTGLE